MQMTLNTDNRYYLGNRDYRKLYALSDECAYTCENNGCGPGVCAFVGVYIHFLKHFKNSRVKDWKLFSLPGVTGMLQ